MNKWNTIKNTSGALKQFALGVAVSAAVVFSSGWPARAAGYSNTVMSLNPVGYWRLGEPAGAPVNYGVGTATNIGTALAAGNGTYYHSPTLQVPGAVAGDLAANLNGTSQYVQVPYSPALNPSNTLTVEFWAKLDIAVTAAKSGVVSRSFVSGGRQTGYLFFVANGNTKWQFRVYNGTAGVTVTDTLGPDIQPDTWYHVTGVYDGTQAHIYVNGVESSPAVTGAYVANTNTLLRIGAGTTEGPATLFFPGTIDEVAVYPTVLSATTIAAHYAAATTNAAGYAAQMLASSPSGYWRLDEPILPPEPVPTPHTASNLGSWGTNADGIWYAGDMNLGAPGVPYHGFGTSNTAGLFTGAGGSYIEIPLQNVAPVSGMTIACWAKRNGVSDPWNMIYSHPFDLGLPTAGSSAPVTGIGFGDSTSRNDQRGYDNGTDANTGQYGWAPSSQMLMPDQQWTFMALVVDSTTNMVIYQNGNSRINSKVFGTHDFSTCASFIGKKQKYFGFGGGEINGFKGTIDEVAIFDQALTPAQIRQLLDAAEVPPIILVQPQTPTPPVYEGMTLSLFVVADVASSTTPLGYQWTKNGLPLSGQTATNYTVSTLATSNSGSYAVVITNAYGAVTSSVVALTVQVGPPIFLQKPQPITRFAGGTATFSTVAVGSPSLSYQWSFNGTPMSGATSSSYTVSGIAAGDAGNYSVLVTNPYGNTNSGNVALTVVSAGGYAAEVMASGPVGYWRCNEASGATAFDYSGGFNGTNMSMAFKNPGPLPTSSPTAYVGFEATNTTYTFTNSGASEVQLPKSFAINQGAFSIVSWVRADTATAYLCIMAQGGNTWRFHLSSDASTLEFFTTGLSGQGGLRGTVNVIDSAWHQAVAVYDGTNKYIYVDGVLDASAAATGLETVDTSLVTIGSQGGWRWNGDIDEVTVYDRGLSASEIANLYRQATSGPGAPEIAVEPVPQTVNVGEPASFSVAAAGGAPYSYQWKHAGTNLPGATKRILLIPSAQFTDAGNYSVGVTNSVGGTMSQVVTLTVVPPQIVTQPVSQTVFAGQPVSFKVVVAGGAPHTYQWSHAGTNLLGATSQTLSLPSTYYTDAGAYSVTITNSVGGPLTSLPATLTVLYPPQFANLTNNLVLHLKFDGDYKDTSGRVNDGTEMGAPTFLVGKIGSNAVHLSTDTASSAYNYLTVSDLNGDLSFAETDSFTVGFWLRYTDGFNDLPVIGNAIRSTYNTGWVITENGGKLEWTAVGGAEVIRDPAGGPAINDGQWHSIVVAFDRTLELASSYVDGALVDSASLTGLGTLVTGSALTLGQDPTGAYNNGGAFDVDDVGIWRRALTPTEAETIYMVGNTYGRTFDTYGPVVLTLRRSGTAMELSWQAGTLLESTNVTGPYVPVSGATAPFFKVTPGSGSKFYRVKL